MNLKSSLDLGKMLTINGSVCPLANTPVSLSKHRVYSTFFLFISYLYFFRFLFHLPITTILCLRAYLCFSLCSHRTSRLSGDYSCYKFRPGCWLFVRFPLVLLFCPHRCRNNTVNCAKTASFHISYN